MLRIFKATTKNKKAIVLVPNALGRGHKADAGKKVIITGTAHYEPNGTLAYIEMESIKKVSTKKPVYYPGIDYSKLDPHIAAQLMAGKKPNPSMDIIGTWPGDETDEEFEQMLKELD